MTVLRDCKMLIITLICNMYAFLGINTFKFDLHRLGNNVCVHYAHYKHIEFAFVF